MIGLAKHFKDFLMHALSYNNRLQSTEIKLGPSYQPGPC